MDGLRQKRLVGGERERDRAIWKEAENFTFLTNSQGGGEIKVDVKEEEPRVYIPGMKIFCSPEIHTHTNRDGEVGKRIFLPFF